MNDIDSGIRPFADGCVFYRQIQGIEDTVNFSHIDSLGKWARYLGMRFQPIRWNMLQLTRKRVKRVIATYTSKEWSWKMWIESSMLIIIIIMTLFIEGVTHSVN